LGTAKIHDFNLTKCTSQYPAMTVAEAENRWLLDPKVLDDSSSASKAVLCARLYLDIEGESSPLSSTRGKEDAIQS
jgi:hypothetical protein